MSSPLKPLQKSPGPCKMSSTVSGTLHFRSKHVDQSDGPGADEYSAEAVCLVNGGGPISTSLCMYNVFRQLLSDQISAQFKSRNEPTSRIPLPCQYILQSLQGS